MFEKLGWRISDARRLKTLEDEDRKLKKLLAESMLGVATLREVLRKTSEAITGFTTVEAMPASGRPIAHFLLKLQPW